MSTIAEHAWNEAGCKIDFGGAKILEKECCYYPRQIREAIEIIKIDNCSQDDGYRINKVRKRVLAN